MNRFEIGLPLRAPALTVRAALVGVIAVVAVLLSGCGAGQVSQMAVQEPAINGSKVTFNNVALRDIRMQAPQTGAFVQPGQPVDLLLVAINQSPDVPDRLVSITSDVGSVSLSGDGRLPAGGMLLIGTPEGQKVAPGPMGSSNAAKATVMLAKPISNGLLYNFTFNFEKAGQATVLVPVSAGLAPAQPS